jgi:adiponectin receptor
MYHLFYLVLYKILRKLDFSGVILLIIGSSFPLFIYGASCVSHLANAYLCIMSILGIIAFCLLVSGYFDPRHRQKKKSLLFGLFGVSFLIPISHISMLEYWDQIKDPMGMSQFVARVLTLGAFYLIGLFIYTVQCP